jgi:hypothetical protein
MLVPQLVTTGAGQHTVVAANMVTGFLIVAILESRTTTLDKNTCGERQQYSGVSQALNKTKFSTVA